MDKPRAKMPKSQRAKQFAPFAGLAGLEIAFRMKEEEAELEMKKELSQESMQEIDLELVRIRKGDNALVRFFSEGKILSVSGRVDLNSPEQQMIRVDGTDIGYGDLYALYSGDAFCGDAVQDIV